LYFSLLDLINCTPGSSYKAGIQQMVDEAPVAEIRHRPRSFLPSTLLRRASLVTATSLRSPADTIVAAYAYGTFCSARSLRLGKIDLLLDLVF
jgi:hypothetical protein